jgi:antitoxin (DNA-binding transcriptional repressor) of toxin-antitoxin stability system
MCSVKSVCMRLSACALKSAPKNKLAKSGMLLIMSYMKRVTLREFKHNSRYQRMAHDGHPVLVTHRGKPYFVAVPPEKGGTFLGAARGGAALTPKLLEPVLGENEWNSAQ